MNAILHNLPVSDDARLMAALGAIAVRCDELLSFAAGDAPVDKTQLRIDAQRIRHFADQARKVIVERSAL